MSYYYSRFPRYESVGSRRAKAQKKLERYKKKNPNINPIIVKGNKLAWTWWGQAWNENLEKYADYYSRIGRGRSYIRNGFVLDLRINKGKVTSLVQGTMTKPYSIKINIKPIQKKDWNQIKKKCEGKIESLQELIEGRFPKALAEIFTTKGKGLFPSPREISFDCNCPDWADMCKHVAAALYAIGVRLDEDPRLFFVLRDLKIDDLIKKAVQGKSKKLLKKADSKSSRVINGSEVADMFGANMIDEIDFNPKIKMKKLKSRPTI